MGGNVNYSVYRLRCISGKALPWINHDSATCEQLRQWLDAAKRFQCGELNVVAESFDDAVEIAERHWGNSGWLSEGSKQLCMKVLGHLPDGYP